MASVLYLKPSNDHHFQIDIRFMAQGGQSQVSEAQLAPSYHLSHFCALMHHGVCDDGKNKFFNYGQPGLLQFHYPAKVFSRVNKVSVSTSLALTPMSATFSTDTSWDRPYAPTTVQEFEVSPNVVTRMF